MICCDQYGLTQSKEGAQLEAHPLMVGRSGVSSSVLVFWRATQRTGNCNLIQGIEGEPTDFWMPLKNGRACLG